MLHILLLLSALLFFRLYAHHPRMDSFSFLRIEHWFEGAVAKLLPWVEKLQSKASLPTMVVALLLVLPIPLLGAFLVKVLSHLGLLSFVGWGVSAIILIFSLGPIDEEGSLTDALWSVQTHIITPLMGYAVAGPLGVLLVVSTRLLATSRAVSAPVAGWARSLLDLLEWLPARLSILLYGLQEDIQAVAKLLLAPSTWMTLKSEFVTKEAAAAAFRNENQQIKPRILVNRLLILWSAVIVLGLLIF